MIADATRPYLQLVSPATNPSTKNNLFLSLPCLLVEYCQTPQNHRTNVTSAQHPSTPADATEAQRDRRFGNAIGYQKFAYSTTAAESFADVRYHDHFGRTGKKKSHNPTAVFQLQV